VLALTRQFQASQYAKSFCMIALVGA